jgi:hypothetical protein
MIPKNIPINGNDSNKPRHLKLVPKGIDPNNNKCVNEDEYIGNLFESITKNTQNQLFDEIPEKPEVIESCECGQPNPIKKTFLWRCLLLSIKTSKYTSIFAIITLAVFFGSLFFLFIQNTIKVFH